MRRPAFEAAAAFDPGQWMYAEDLDLAWRLDESGWATRYVPEAHVRHEVSAAARKAFADERTARHMAAAHDWMVRRRGAAVAQGYAAINALGSAVRLLALAPLARLAPERFGPRRDLEARLPALAWRRVAHPAKGPTGPALTPGPVACAL